MLAQHGEAEDESGEADAGEHEAVQVQRRHVLSAHVLDERVARMMPRMPMGVDEKKMSRQSN